MCIKRFLILLKIKLILAKERRAFKKKLTKRDNFFVGVINPFIQDIVDLITISFPLLVVQNYAVLNWCLEMLLMEIVFYCQGWGCCYPLPESQASCCWCPWKWMSWTGSLPGVIVISNSQECRFWVGYREEFLWKKP